MTIYVPKCRRWSQLVLENVRLDGISRALQHNSAWEPCRTHDDVGRRSLYRVNLSLELNIIDETPLPRTSMPFNLSRTLESQIFFSQLSTRTTFHTLWGALVFTSVNQRYIPPVLSTVWTSLPMWMTPSQPAPTSPTI